MLPNVRKSFVQLAIALAIVTASGFVAVAQESWRVDKSSGETWVTKSGIQPAALSQETTLQPGDGIRTGRNGRVLLVRGEERILVSPNTVIAIPERANEGLATTVVQQAGSILLQVDKRDTKHFEVETPYLAAVVKGTEFSVTVNETGTKVDVVQGKVEVADFKSGQFALVLPGQTAGVSASGKPGLSLSGAGTLSPIQQGPPRATSVQRIAVPKGGLTAPSGSGRSVASLKGPESNKGIAIKSAVGEVKLNIHKVTNGLARDASSSPANGKAAQNSTVWGSKNSSANDGRGPGSASSHSLGSHSMGGINSHASAHGKSKEHHANNGHGKGGNPGHGGGNGGGGNGGGGNGGGGNGGGGNGGGGNGGGGNGGGRR